MVRLHLFIQKWQQRSRSGEGVEVKGGAGRGREQIQTRWRLEEGTDGGMVGGMRGQVCAQNPYKAWMTGKLWKGSRDITGIYTVPAGRDTA